MLIPPPRAKKTQKLSPFYSCSKQLYAVGTRYPHQRTILLSAHTSCRQNQHVPITLQNLVTTVVAKVLRPAGRGRHHFIYCYTRITLIAYSTRERRNSTFIHTGVHAIIIVFEDTNFLDMRRSPNKTTAGRGWAGRRGRLKYPYVHVSSTRLSHAFR